MISGYLFQDITIFEDGFKLMLYDDRISNLSSSASNGTSLPSSSKANEMIIKDNALKRWSVQTFLRP
jgi:hypothetical protein